MQIQIVQNYLTDYTHTSKPISEFYTKYIEELINNKKQNNEYISYDSKASTLVITCTTQACSQKMQFKIDLNTKQSLSYTCPYCNVELFSSKFKMQPIQPIVLPKISIMICGMIIEKIRTWLQDLGDPNDICEIIRKEDYISFLCTDYLTKSNYLRIELYFYHSIRKVCIPTILVIDKLKHTGTGMRMIRDVYDFCKMLNYELYIVNMVPSFYERMTNRGAEQTDLDEVKITDKTDLSYHY